jgi:hypothetical protein
VIERAAQEGRASARSSEQLQRLHRHDHKRESAVQGEAPGVRDDGLDGQPLRAMPERVQQRRVGVQGDDRDSAGGEVQRDATGARADVQHRPAGVVG